MFCWTLFSQNNEIFSVHGLCKMHLFSITVNKNKWQQFKNFYWRIYTFNYLRILNGIASIFFKNKNVLNHTELESIMTLLRFTRNFYWPRIHISLIKTRANPEVIHNVIVRSVFHWDTEIFVLSIKHKKLSY